MAPNKADTIPEAAKDGHHEHYYLKRIIRYVLDFITFNVIGYFIQPKRGIFVIPAITDPLLLEPATTVADKIRRGQVTSERVVKAYIDRIKLVDPLINAVVHNRFEAAIKDAQELDRQIKQEIERMSVVSPSLTGSIEMVSTSDVRTPDSGSGSNGTASTDVTSTQDVPGDKKEDGSVDNVDEQPSTITTETKPEAGGDVVVSGEVIDSGSSETSSVTSNPESLNKSSDLLSKPLLGVPFTGKDSIAVNGLYQTSGMYCRKFIRATIDAQVTANLKTIGGAIPIAITNVPEYCFWFDSQNTIFGRTNNPYDLSRVPGGSSGGQAAVISYAGSIIGNASDIGGSIRIPAAFCGIFGHKPTPGIVPTHGHHPRIPMERQKMLSMGPLVRYAADLIPMFKVMAGGEEVVKKFVPKIDEKVNFRSVNVFWMDDNYDDPLTTPVDPEIKKAIHAVAMYFNKQFGSKVRKVSFPGISESFDIWLENYKIENEPSLASQLVDGKYEPNMWMEVVKKLIGLSQFTWSLICLSIFSAQTGAITENTKKYIEKADRLRKEMLDMFNKNDNVSNEESSFEGSIFLYPSHPELAPKHHTTIAKINHTSYTAIFNVLGFPVTQVPLGLNREGLPIGIQVVAAPFFDHLTLNAAIELEKKFGGWVPPCKVDIKRPSRVSETRS